MVNCATQQNSYIPLIKNRFEPVSNYQSQDPPHNCDQTKFKSMQRSRNSARKKHRIVLLHDSQVRGCSAKLSDILGSSCNIIGITNPNANVKAITNSIDLKDENLTKKDVIICSGTRYVAKKEAKDGLRILLEFVKRTVNTNVIVTCVPRCFELQLLSCVNKEVESFNRKLQKAMKTFSHMHVCSMSTNRDHFTSYGLYLNSQGKNWFINKWASIITPIISKPRVISVTPLPWMKKSDNTSYDEHEHRKELVTEGMNMPKEKVFMYQSASKLKKTSEHRNGLSKEEIFYSATELEVGREYREERVIKETPGLTTSITSIQCKRLVEEDAKYGVPKMDVTYRLREEEEGK